MRTILTMNFCLSLSLFLGSEHSRSQIPYWNEKCWKIRRIFLNVVICTNVYVLLVAYMLSTYVVAQWTCLFFTFNSAPFIITRTYIAKSKWKMFLNPYITKRESKRWAYVIFVLSQSFFVWAVKKTCWIAFYSMSSFFFSLWTSS